MDSMFSFKDFEKVHLKATYDIEIGNRKISKGETICIFDKIQIAGLSDLNEHIAARGGFANRARVFWDTTKEEKLVFSQGVFSKTQFALLSNARLIDTTEDFGVQVTESEVLESNENCKFTLKEIPYKDLFVYDLSTGAKLEFTINEKEVTIATPFTDVVVNYVYIYTSGAHIFQLGRRLINGFVELEGRTRVKDDTTGHVVTGLFRIPHLKLMSDLSIRLGAQANPVVANFTATAYPVGSQGNSFISEFYYLSDDLDSDL